MDIYNKMREMRERAFKRAFDSLDIEIKVVPRTSVGGELENFYRESIINNGNKEGLYNILLQQFEYSDNKMELPKKFNETPSVGEKRNHSAPFDEEYIPFDDFDEDCLPSDNKLRKVAYSSSTSSEGHSLDSLDELLLNNEWFALSSEETRPERPNPHLVKENEKERYFSWSDYEDEDEDKAVSSASNATLNPDFITWKQEQKYGFINSLYGLSFEEAEKECKQWNVTLRMLSHDHQVIPVTFDFSPNRINVACEGPNAIILEHPEPRIG